MKQLTAAASPAASRTEQRQYLQEKEALLSPFYTQQTGGGRLNNWPKVREMGCARARNRSMMLLERLVLRPALLSCVPECS